MNSTSQKRPSVGQSLVRHFRSTLVAGLLLLVPVVITYLVLRLLFTSIDSLLQPGVEAILGRKIPGLGILVLAFLVYLAGLFSVNVLGKQAVKLGQNILLRIPVIRAVYSPAKQLIESFSDIKATGFKRVVLIEYPRAGAWTVGFLTGVTSDENGRRMALVYIPTAPTPQSGWVALVPVEDVFDTDLSVQVALQMVLSGGIVTPPQIRKKATTI
ncbi:MAG: DUF502 domain-containing protein [Chloroflexi bacterium]|nr:DUF502 domain-containing protein [Chloroflexota bacterium]